jgi:hypothetical protein
MYRDVKFCCIICPMGFACCGEETRLFANAPHQVDQKSKDLQILWAATY